MLRGVRLVHTEDTADFTKKGEIERLADMLWRGHLRGSMAATRSENATLVLDHQRLCCRGS